MWNKIKNGWNKTKKFLIPIGTVVLSVFAFIGGRGSTNKAFSRLRKLNRDLLRDTEQLRRNNEELARRQQQLESTNKQLEESIGELQGVRDGIGTTNRQLEETIGILQRSSERSSEDIRKQQTINSELRDRLERTKQAIKDSEA